MIFKIFFILDGSSIWLLECVARPEGDADGVIDADFLDLGITIQVQTGKLLAADQVGHFLGVVAADVGETKILPFARIDPGERNLGHGEQYPPEFIIPAVGIIIFMPEFGRDLGLLEDDENLALRQPGGDDHAPQQGQVAGDIHELFPAQILDEDRLAEDIGVGGEAGDGAAGAVVDADEGATGLDGSRGCRWFNEKSIHGQFSGCGLVFGLEFSG